MAILTEEEKRWRDYLTASYSRSSTDFAKQHAAQAPASKAVRDAAAAKTTSYKLVPLGDSRNALEEARLTVKQLAKTKPTVDLDYKLPTDRMPTLLEQLTSALTVNMKDKEKGKELYGKLWEQMQDPTSPYYAPYATGTATNWKALGELGSLLGQDFSKGITAAQMDEIAQAVGWNPRLTATGTTPAAPTKKSTIEENVTYWLNKIYTAEENTAAAESDLKRLRADIQELVNDPRSYSDDEILERLDFAKNYKTLSKMQEGKAGKNPVALNRAIDWDDSFIGSIIWAARNSGGSKSILGDVVYSTRNMGNTYRPDERAVASRDPESLLYNPNKYGTMADDLRMLGVPRGTTVTRELMDSLRTQIPETDEARLAAFRRVNDGLTTEQALRDEWTQVEKTVDFYIRKGYTDEQIREIVTAQDYKTLAKFDESIYERGNLALPNGFDKGLKWLDGLLLDRRTQGKTGMKDDMPFMAVAYAQHAGEFAPNESQRRLAGMRDPTSAEYNPYFEATAADVLLHFDLDSITRDDLPELAARVKASGGDGQSWYNKAVSAVENSEKAQGEASDLKREIDSLMRRGYTPDEIQERIYSDADDFKARYPTLSKMDDARRLGGKLPLGFAVAYRAEDALREAKHTYDAEQAIKLASERSLPKIPDTPDFRDRLNKFGFPEAAAPNVNQAAPVDTTAYIGGGVKAFTIKDQKRLEELDKLLASPLADVSGTFSLNERFAPDNFSLAPIMEQDERQRLEGERATLQARRDEFNKAGQGVPRIVDAIAPLAASAGFQGLTPDEASAALSGDAQGVPDWYSGLLFQMAVYTEWTTAELKAIMPYASAMDITPESLSASGASDAFITRVMDMRDDLTRVLEQPIVARKADGWMDDALNWYSGSDSMAGAAAEARGDTTAWYQNTTGGMTDAVMQTSRQVMGAGEFLVGGLHDLIWGKENRPADAPEGKARSMQELIGGMAAQINDGLDQVDNYLDEARRFMEKNGSTADNFAYALTRDAAKTAIDYGGGGAAGMTWFGVSGFGGDWADTRNDPELGALNRMISAGIAGVSEAVTNKILGVRGGFADNAAAMLGVDKLTSRGGQFILKTLLSSAGEAIEEFVQGMTTEPLQDVVKGRFDSWGTYLDQSLRSALSAFITNAPYAAAQNAGNYTASTINTGKPAMMPTAPMDQAAPPAPSAQMEQAAPPAPPAKPLLTPESSIRETLVIGGAMPDDSAGYQAVAALSQRMEAGEKIPLNEMNEIVQVVYNDAQKPAIINEVRKLSEDMTVSRAKVRLIAEGILDGVLTSVPGYKTAVDKLASSESDLQKATVEYKAALADEDLARQDFERERSIMADPAKFAQDLQAASRYRAAEKRVRQAADKTSSIMWQIDDAQNERDEATAEVQKAEQRAMRIIQTQAIEQVTLQNNEKARNNAYRGIKDAYGFAESAQSIRKNMEQEIVQIVQNKELTPEDVYKELHDLTARALVDMTVTTQDTDSLRTLRGQLRKPMTLGRKQSVLDNDGTMRKSGYAQINEDRRDYFGKLQFTDRFEASSPDELLNNLVETGYVSPSQFDDTMSEADQIELLKTLADRAYKKETYANSYDPAMVDEATRNITDILYETYTGEKPPVTLTESVEDYDEQWLAAQQKLDEQTLERIEATALAEPYDRSAPDFAPIVEAARNVKLDTPLASLRDTAGTPSLEVRKAAALLNGITKRIGVTYQFETMGEPAEAGEGYYDRTTNTIVINNALTTADAVRAVMVHEATHPLEGTPEYEELAQFLMDFEYRGRISDYAAAMSEVKDRYAQRGKQLDNEGARHEVVADLMRQAYERSDGKMLTRLAAEKPGIARRIYDTLKNMLASLKRLTWDAEKRDEYRMLRKAETLLGHAIAAVNANGQTANGSARQFSIASDSQGRYVHVDVDQARFDGLMDDADRLREAKAVINERFKRKTIGNSDNASKVTGRSVGEFIRGPMSASSLGYIEPKMRLSTELDNVMEIAEYLGPEPTKHKKRYFNDKGMDRYSARFEIGGTAYLGEFLVATNEDGMRVFYGMPYLEPVAKEYNGAAHIGLLGDAPILRASGPEASGTPTQQQASTVEGLPVASNGISIAQSDIKMQAPSENNFSGDSTGQDVQYSIPGATENQNAILKALRDDYGTIEPGASPARRIELPKQTSSESAVSYFARTTLEYGKLNNSLDKSFAEAIVKGEFSHIIQTDKRAMSRADAVMAEGLPSAEQSWSEAYSGGKLVTKDQFAVAARLLQEHLKGGDADRAVRLSAEMAQALTNAGQLVQAASLLKQAGPGARAVLYRNLVRSLNTELQKKYPGGWKDETAEGGVAHGVKVNGDLLGQLMIAKTEAQREALEGEIRADLIKQLPLTNLAERLNSFRHVAMLGNARTLLRNELGNAAMVPAVRMRNLIAAGLERTLPKSERSKVLHVDQVYLKVAEAALTQQGGKITSGKKMSEAQEILQDRPVFRTKGMNAFNSLVSGLMEKSDSRYKRHYYLQAMGGFLQARGVDVSKGLDGIDSKTVTEAVDYANQEALRNTFNDASVVAKKLNDLARSHPVANVIIEGVLPFKRTPINIMKRGLEYSPLGLVEAITYESYRLKRGDITSAEYISRLASGIEGTGVAALGALLSSLGVLQGYLDKDDPEDQLLIQAGKQSYSLNVGGVSYTVDWLTPIAFPLFMGAQLHDLMNDDSPTSVAEFTELVTNVANPLFNLSMLDGINTAIEQSAQTNGNTLQAFVVNSALNYGNQFVPSILGQTARSADPNRRLLYPDKDNPWASNVQYAMQRTANKIPYLSTFRQPWLDVWGEEDYTQNAALRVLENFLSPGFANSVSVDAVEQEIARLYDAAGMKNVVNRGAPKSFSFEGSTRNLNAEEYTQVQRVRGETAKTLIADLITMDLYAAWDDRLRAEGVMDAYELATSIAKRSIEPNVTLDAWQADAARSLQVGDVSGATVGIAAHVQDGEANKQAKAARESIYSAIHAGAIDDAMIGIEAIIDAKRESGRSYNQARSEVKSSVSSEFDDIYKDAYAAGDLERMRMIEDTLLSIGLNFKFSDFGKWLE